MEKSRKCTETSNGNKHKNSKGTREKPMSPSKMSPEEDRMSIKIPKKAKIYEYLHGDNGHDNRPAWQRLDTIYDQSQHNKELYAVTLYDDFVTRVAVFFPDKIEELNKLRPLIIKHILKGAPLDMTYYEMLQEL